jgi:hypothetical protein
MSEFMDLEWYGVEKTSVSQSTNPQTPQILRSSNSQNPYVLKSSNPEILNLLRSL